MTIGLGLPIWMTCDHYLLKILPTVLWFDPREPFAPFSPLPSTLDAFGSHPGRRAAGHVSLGALTRCPRCPVPPGADDVARRLALHGPTSVRNPQLIPWLSQSGRSVPRLVPAKAGLQFLSRQGHGRLSLRLSGPHRSRWLFPRCGALAGRHGLGRDARPSASGLASP